MLSKFRKQHLSYLNIVGEDGWEEFNLHISLKIFEQGTRSLLWKLRVALVLTLIRFVHRISEM